MATEQGMETPQRPRVSAAELEMAIAGIDFPKTKDELVQYASSKVPSDSAVLDEIRKLPDGTYRTASDVAQGFGEVKSEERREG